MNFHIISGDALSVLRELPDSLVQCVCSSPPYYGLRRYLPPGHPDEGKEIGKEQTPEEYVANLVAVFREVRRVLRDDGVLFCNLGDSFNAAGRSGHGTRQGYKQGTNRASAEKVDTTRPNSETCKEKDLLGIPWMVAFALRADGWCLRSELIWAKGYSFHPTTAGSCMPESCKDRPTRSHEHIFMLTKSPRYFYDYEAVTEEGIWKAGTRAAKGSGTREGNRRGPPKHGRNSDAGHRSSPPGGYMPTPYREHNSGGQTAGKDDDGYVTYSGKRNLRSVWCINPRGYRDAHFATYPEALVEPMIRAATSEKGCCPKCGAPWTRIVDVTIYRDRPRALENHAANANENPQGGYRGTRESQTVGWAPGCSCGEDPIPCLVLDPFAGAGTTLLVAVKLGRRGIGIELNQAYVDMANKRIQEAE